MSLGPGTWCTPQGLPCLETRPKVPLESARQAGGRGLLPTPRLGFTLTFAISTEQTPVREVPPRQTSIFINPTIINSHGSGGSRRRRGLPPGLWAKEG